MADLVFYPRYGTIKPVEPFIDQTGAKCFKYLATSAYRKREPITFWTKDAAQFWLTCVAYPIERRRGIGGVV